MLGRVQGCPPQGAVASLKEDFFRAADRSRVGVSAGRAKKRADRVEMASRVATTGVRVTCSLGQAEAHGDDRPSGRACQPCSPFSITRPRPLYHVSKTNVSTVMPGAPQRSAAWIWSYLSPGFSFAGSGPLLEQWRSRQSMTKRPRGLFFQRL